MPTISVVIPNYNRAHLVGETLENMLRQTRPPDELIVVDDGSTDDSAGVINSFGDRVRLLRQLNSGPAVARNRGFDLATGDFVQFFDSDDLCTLNKLEVQAGALTRTGADIAYGPWLKARLEDRRAVYSEPPLQQRGLPDRHGALSWFLKGWVIVFQCCMFRRSFLTKVGCYRSELMPSEDSEFLFRMLKAGARTVHVPEALVLYRVHEEGQISAGGMTSAARALDWMRFAEIVMGQLNGEGEPVEPLDALNWRATVWAAHESAARVAGGAALEQGYDTRFGRAESGFYWLLKRAAQLRAGLRWRLSGTRVPPFFQPGALTSNQERLIRQVGFEPTPARASCTWLRARNAETL